MKIRTIKRIDRFAGSFICFIFSVFDRLTCIMYPAKRKNSRGLNDPGKILLINFWGMGNLVILIPVIRAIRKKYVSSEIVMFTVSCNAGLLENIPEIDRAVYVDVDNYRGFFRSILKRLADFRSENFDLCINFEKFSRISTIAAYLSNIPARIEFHSNFVYRGGLSTLKVRFDESMHILDNFANLVKPAGVLIEERKLCRIRYREDTLSRVNGLLERETRKDKRLIGISAGTGRNARVRGWPCSDYARLADKLINDLDAEVVFTGSASERRLISGIIGMMENRAENFAGRTDINELACLIEKCSLFISNNSGPAHLAEAMGTCSFVIFGPASPHMYGPLSGDNRVFFRNMECSPCLSVRNLHTSGCRNPVCLGRISVEEVFNGVMERLR